MFPLKFGLPRRDLHVTFPTGPDVASHLRRSLGIFFETFDTLARVSLVGTLVPILPLLATRGESSRSRQHTAAPHSSHAPCLGTLA